MCNIFSHLISLGLRFAIYRASIIIDDILGTPGLGVSRKKRENANRSATSAESNVIRFRDAEKGRGEKETETRGTTSSISSVPLSSSISNRSQDEYRIDAARTSSRRSGFTLEGVTRGERERESEKKRELCVCV